MSGIYGIFAFQRPVARQELEGMGKPLLHCGPDAEGVWLEESVGLGCRLLRVTPESAQEQQPLATGSVVVVLDGRIDNREELIAGLAATGVHAQSPDPELVAAAYRAWGEQMPARLVGDFALALFDRERKSLLLARDPFGLRTLYYCQAGGALLFASQIKALLAHPDVSAAPDETSLANWFLHRRRFIGDATCFRDIHNLLPGHALLATCSGITARRYWDFDGVQPLQLRGFPEYAEAFRAAFQMAVKRRMRSRAPVTVWLSGGLDSSAIFCTGEVLRRQSKALPELVGLSLTYPEGTPSDEKLYLEAIERQYGSRIQRFHIADTGFFERLAEVIWHVEMPLVGNDWDSLLRKFQAAAELGSRVNLSGGFGDQVLVNTAYLADLTRKMRWGTVREHMREYPRWESDGDPTAFRRQYRNALLRSLLPERVLPWLRRMRPVSAETNPLPAVFTPEFLQHADAAAAVESKKWHYSAHASHVCHMVRAKWYLNIIEWTVKVERMFSSTVAFPFLDRDLVCLLMSMPGEMVMKGGVPKGILRESLRDVLPAAIAGRAGKAGFTWLANRGVEREFPRIQELFERPLSVEYGYLRRDKLESELTRLRAQAQRSTDSKAALQLMDLVGLELWLRAFFGKQNPSRSFDTLKAHASG